MEHAGRFFTAAYRERTALRDGAVVELRLVQPEDRDRLRAGFERLSMESRYARFLGPKTALSDDELDYLTRLDHESHLAIGAVATESAADPGSEPGSEPGAMAAGTADMMPGSARQSIPDRHPRHAGVQVEEGRGLGIARFIRLADTPTLAEAAIAVADEAQGRGLGKLLFLRLCAAAAERGVERFRCDVLGSNHGMKELLDRITPERTIQSGGGIMTIELAIPGVTPTEPPTEPGPQGAMYKLFQAAASNAVEWTAAVRNLWRR